MGSGGGGIWTSSESKMQAAYGQLRSAAQAVGGDYALIDMVASDLRGVTISAHAYDCSRTPPAQASSQPPAGAGASADERLRRLDKLKQDGLVTPTSTPPSAAPFSTASDRVCGDGCLSPVLVRAHDCSWCVSFWWVWSRALAWRPVGEGAVGPVTGPVTYYKDVLPLVERALRGLPRAGWVRAVLADVLRRGARLRGARRGGHEVGRDAALAARGRLR